MAEKIDKRKRIITYLTVCVALLNLAVVDAKVISSIRQKSVEEYMTVDAGASTKKVKKGTVETTFVPVSNEIHGIYLKGVFSAKEKDKLDYRILNSKGQELCHQEGIFISEIYDSQKQRLSLVVTGADFQRGETYRLQVSFDMTTKAELSMDKNGIVLAQEYAVSYQGCLYGLMVVIHLLVAGFICAVYKWGFNDKVFLGVLLSVGVLAVVLSAPFSRGDEFRHFVRVYDLATGHEYYHYGEMPETVYGVVTKDEDGDAAYVKIPAEIDAMRQLDLENQYGASGYLSERNVNLCIPKLQTMLSTTPGEDRVWVSASGTYGRPLCAYWPQVFMVWLGNLLGFRGIYLYYLAKLGQMLVVSLAYWLAWRMASNYKYLFGVMALNPAGVLLGASCSSDGLMIAEVALGIAMVLHARDKKVSLATWRGILYWGCFAVLVYWILRTKLPYAMVCLGFLPVLIEKKPSKKTLGLLAVFGAGLVTFFLIRRDVTQRCMEMLMTAEHWQYWMENFRWVTYMMLRKGADLMVETFCALKGNGLIPYNGLVLLVAVLSKRRFGILQKLYSLFLFFVMLLVIVMFGYSLTPPDYGDIWGVTYRYVLPFVPLFVLALPVGNESTEKVLDACYPVLLITVVFALVYTFGMF